MSRTIAVCATVCGLAVPRAPAQDAATEPMPASIERGLVWLVAEQLEDGRWSDGTGPAGARIVAACDGSSHDAATTSLALLALCASGSTVRSGPDAEAVRRGAVWLATQLDESGTVAPAPRFRRELDQALVALALAEVVGLSSLGGDHPLHAAAANATAALVAARRPSGRWETELAPGEMDTCLVTAWAAMALGSARNFALRSTRGDRPVWIESNEGDTVTPETRAVHSARLVLSGLNGNGAREAGEADRPPVDLDAVAADAGAVRDDPLARQLAAWGSLWSGGATRDRVRQALADVLAAQERNGSWAASKRWRADGGGDVSSSALTILTLRVSYRVTRVRRGR